MFTLLSSATALLALSSALSEAQARCAPKNYPVKKPDGGHNHTSKFIAKGYYAGWNSDDFKPENVSWSKYTHLTYAFGIPTNTANFDISLNGSNPESLDPFVSAAHEHGVEVSLSIGGWTGSRFFSYAVGSEQNRTAFVKTLVDFAVAHKLDGLDMDWEYPFRQGLGCNALNPNDTSNLLLFLQEFRRDPVGANLTLSAAGSLAVWNDFTGNPSTNVSGFADVFDHFVIMNYDVWGSWSETVGPNAPLNDTCAAPAQQQGSAISSVNKWTQAGMPLEKIVLGVGAYAHSFSVNKTNAYVNGTKELAAYPPFNKDIHPKGDKWDDPEGAVDFCGVTNHAGGIFTFWGLIEHGYLNEDGSPKAPYRFDNCSRTAYAYDEKEQVMVSFDDAQAFKDKGAWIKEKGLAGFSVWNAGSDHKDILLDAIRSGAGLSK
ncbi:glycoside hydrolase family 18 protein [Moniliophthora roreri MCA 2997]|uniref:Glycoside hydrolase family 18 protein n=2 Tax=Moniliophthora roreri TaxID=221103 RepID=V2X214_MONRO|nr:glycoside hydrolase family 18 protein [Moniliophthora roreri MCA 2997]KAI3604304.1 glycoside hydrolase family 18 protein [Moniliophthora roreri]